MNELENRRRHIKKLSHAKAAALQGGQSPVSVLPPDRRRRRRGRRRRGAAAAHVAEPSRTLSIGALDVTVLSEALKADAGAA